MTSLTAWTSFLEGSLHCADLISVSGTRKPRSSGADNDPSLNQRPRKGGLTGGPVILLAEFLRTSSELEDAGRFSFGYLVMDLWKGLSPEPLECFAENSAGCSTVTHPKQATAAAPPPPLASN